MRADTIIDIVHSLPDLPYRCIFFDGAWGIGKSYAVHKALQECKNVCYISMFGLQSGQKIYHEVLFQLALKNNAGGKIGEIAGNILDGLSVISGKMAQAKEVLDSIAKQRELFLLLSEQFHEPHTVVLDDLERISEQVSLQEVLGIVEELKRCQYVKVILVANTLELSGENLEILERYQEKVVDRIYQITERPQHIDWGDLGIDAAFMTDFLSRHPVVNLRTLQKAQNFYEDVKCQCEGVGDASFLQEIRLVCFATVVEDIDQLYYTEPAESETDRTKRYYQLISAQFPHRVARYLVNTKSGKGLQELIYGYYKNESGISKVVLEMEYDLFCKAGRKPNLYKSDEEIKVYIAGWRERLEQTEDVGELVRLADEYVYWGEIVGLDVTEILDIYRARLYVLLWERAQEGNGDVLSYGVAAYHISSARVREQYSSVQEELKARLVNTFIAYLAEHMSDFRAFEISRKLRDYYDSSNYRTMIDERIEALLIRSSFPVDDMTEHKYHACYNVMYILYRHNAEQCKAYCEKLGKECDGMARHRIKNLMEEIEGAIQ